MFSFHDVQEKHEIVLNKTGAHLLDGRLVFRRRCNGSSLRATRVLVRRNANASTALLATFVESPSHRSDGPPPPLPSASVASLVANQKKSGVSSSCRARNTFTGTNKKRYRVPWGTGGSFESMSRGNGGMAAAVLSPGDVFVDKKKKKTR